MFWRCTPRQLAVHFDAIGLRNRREHNARAWLAWHIAALMRTPRDKRLPALGRLEAKQPTAARQQSWQEQLAIMKSWSARLDKRAAKRS